MEGKINLSEVLGGLNGDGSHPCAAVLKEHKKNKTVKELVLVVCVMDRTWVTVT